MTTSPPPSVTSLLTDDPDLDGLDLAAATLLVQAFGPVRSSRPAPVPQLAQVRRPSRRSPSRRSPSARRALGAAAATLALGAGVAAVGSGLLAPSPAWAATPRAVSAADEEAARRACGAALVEAEGESATLPAATIMDVRGTRALALYTDAARTVECMLEQDGDTWAGASVRSSTPTGGVTVENLGVSLEFTAPLTLRDGSTVRYLTGTAPEKVTAMELRSPQGIVAATVRDGRYAVWLPVDRSLVAAVLMPVVGQAPQERSAISMELLPGAGGGDGSRDRVADLEPEDRIVIGTE